MKKINSLILALSLLIVTLAFSGAPAAYAADIAAEKLFTYSENLEDGVAVFPNGDIYVKSGNYINGFKQSGASNGFSVQLPSGYCGNLCSTADGLLFAYSTNSSAIYVYEPLKSTERKTVYANQTCRFINVSGGYLYALQGETDLGTGKKTAVVRRAKISEIKALNNEDMINWDKVYNPKYTPPNEDGNAYPAALAVDENGNAYIVDKGSSNGYDASVNGIYKYNFSTGKVTAMKFVDSGNTLVGLTWLYSVNVDSFGNVAVLSRNSNILAIFRPGSVNADYLLNTNGWCEDLASDENGDLYFISYGNVNTGNCVYKCALNNVGVTGLNISATAKTLNIGASFNLGAFVAPSDSTNKQIIYSSSNGKVASVSETGAVKAVSAGTAVITVKTAQGGFSKTCKITVNKLPNTLAASGKTAKLKYSSLKKKNLTVARKNAFVIKNAKGTLTFKRVKGNKKITVNSAGKITVKKGLKKGTYKLTVKVTAAGNSSYKAAVKTVTVKIVIK